MAYECTASQFQQVLEFVHDPAVAQSICSTVQVGADVTTALLQYALDMPSHTEHRALGEVDDALAVAEDTFLGLDVWFLLLSAYLVFAMQAGFAMVACGCVRSKNVTNIMLKNVLDSAVGGVFYYLIGYGLQFGVPTGDRSGKIDTTTDILGESDFALSQTDNSGAYHSFIFQWAFAAAATTIVSGAVAERTTLIAYLGYSILLISWVYPVFAHWVWSSNGWLNAFKSDGKLFKGTGAIDFAGSGVVHMVGGTAALWGAVIVGPRIGRFDASGKPTSMPGHNSAYVVLGTFLLWFGWYGFNPGSQLLVHGSNAAIVARTAVTTTTAAAAGGVSAMFIKYSMTHTYDVFTTCNGVLGGLVAITSPCSTIMVWAAVLLGFLVGPVIVFGEFLLLKLKIDDVVGAVPVHMFCGAFGVLYAGFFVRPIYFCEVYGNCDPKNAGVVYGGEGNLLLAQLTEVACILAWVSGHMIVFFSIFRLIGKLRVPAQVEMAGLDISKHGGSAYTFDDGAATTASGGLVQVKPNHVMPFKG